MSVGSNIYPEFGIPALTTKYISRDLFPLVGGTASTLCYLGASFSGKSAVSTYKKSAYFFNPTLNPSHLYTSITCDSVGTIYAGGYYSQASAVSNAAVNPSGTAGTVAAGVGTPTVISKWDSNGIFKGSAIIAGLTSQVVQCTDVKCDSLNNVYLTLYNGSAIALRISSFALNAVTTTTPTGTTPASASAVVAKWNSSGTYQGAAVVTSAFNSRAYSVNFDGSNNIYVYGITGGTSGASQTITSFAVNPTTATTPTGTLPGSSYYVAKWTSAGSYVSSAVIINISPSTGDFGTVTINSSGDIYVNGYYTATVNPIVTSFAVSPTSSSTPTGTHPIPLVSSRTPFIARWNSTGTYISSTIITSDVSNEGATSAGMAVDSSGNIYMCGFYNLNNSGITGTGTAAYTVSSFALNPTTGTTPTGTLPATATSFTTGYVSKWSSTGTYLGSAIMKNLQSRFSGVACKGTDVYVVGYYNAFTGSGAIVTNFGINPSVTGATFTDNPTTGSGLVIGWNSSGTYLQCAKLLGSVNTQRIRLLQTSNIAVTYSRIGTLNITNFGTNPTATAGTVPASGGAHGAFSYWSV